MNAPRPEPSPRPLPGLLRPAVLTFVAFLLALPVSAADPAELLLEGKWAKAEKKAARELAEVVRSSWDDPDVGREVGELLRIRAVAAANLGDDHRAVWLWHLATQVHLPLARRATEQPGRASELFAAHPLRALGRAPEGVELARTPIRGKLEHARLPGVPPMDVWNAGARRDRPPPLRFEVLVGADGHLSHPRLQGDPHPVLVAGALAAWGEMDPVEPTRIDGEPVPWLFPVEIPFHVGRW